VIDQLVIDVAESVGRKTANDWPFMDADDITQELLLIACTRPDDYNAMGEEELRAFLGRKAVAYCARERNDYVYRTARYLYTVEEVKVLLSLAVESVGVDFDAPTKDGYVSAPDRGNVVVSLWDLQQALDGIPGNWRRILMRRAEVEGFNAQQRQAAMDAGWQPLSESEQRTARRATERLTEVLNRIVNRTPGEHDGPGSRRAMSNARGQVMTHGERAGE
jgi:DNA-directed RNA polymerase specialized sigma24 family protein